MDLTLTGSTLTTDGLARIDADLDDFLLPYMCNTSLYGSLALSGRYGNRTLASPPQHATRPMLILRGGPGANPSLTLH